MKKAIIIAGIITVVGLAVSVALIPQTPEIALINYKDKRFDEARTAYEKQRASGELNPDVVNKLVELYLQDGKVIEAVQVMEKFIEIRPKDIAARKKMGELYQFAQRQEDYVRNLEAINAIEADAKTLEQLAQIYNFSSEYDKQVETLQKLIITEKGENPQPFKDLATILASQQAKEEAVVTLQDLKKRHGDAFEFSQMELLVSLLLDLGRIDEALTHAQEWRAKHDKPMRVARLINLLHFKGNADAAMKLLGTFDAAEIENSSALLEEQILLLIAYKQEDKAYERLKALYAEEKLSPPLQQRLLFMALARDDRAVAANLINAINFNVLAESDLLTLLEIAIVQDRKDILKKLSEAQVNEVNSMPVFNNLLAMAERKPDAEKRVMALKDTDISQEQRLQIARVCVQLGNQGCSIAFIDSLPNPEQLSNQQIADVAELYFDLREYKIGKALLNKVEAERGQSAQLAWVTAKYAAAEGDRDTVINVLSDQGNALDAVRMVSLYFIARNNGHHGLSISIAERLYAAEENAESRSYLASAYISNRQYNKAVALLQNAKDLSSDDESNYLMALTKLSAQSPAYRKMLGDYAASQLRADISSKRKLALIYALIDAGQVEPALPYIRQLALRRGGRWAALYAETLDKQGRYDESREFWLTYARQTSTTSKVKREVAYTLLNNGYKEDAELLLRALASGSAPDSEPIKELLYLWGTRPADSELDWLVGEMQATQAAESAGFAQMIADRTGDDEILDLITRHPSILHHPALLRRYIQALGAKGELVKEHDVLLSAIVETQDPILLEVYAETARAYDAEAQALDAYKALIQLEPENQNELREMGILAFAQADYSFSRYTIENYLGQVQISPVPSDKLIAPMFYYAEIMRREYGLGEEALAYYMNTLEHIENAERITPEMLSIQAQSLIWLGDEAEGFAVFESAISRYSGNEVLRADYINALIDLEYYADARILLANARQRMEQDITQYEPMLLDDRILNGYRTHSDDREIVLSVNDAKQVPPALVNYAVTYPWVSYSTEGYGQVLVAAISGVRVRLERDEQDQLVLVPYPDNRGTARQQIILRYALLAARTDLESGNLLAATERLQPLLEEHPEDAQLLGYVANAENYAGNWRRASRLLKQAHAISPINEDVVDLQRSINREHAINFVKADYEWISRGDEREHRTTIHAEVAVDDALSLGVMVQNSWAKLKEFDISRELEKQRQRAELYGQYFWENGQEVKLALFANRETPGAGGYYQFINALGISGVELEYLKPYWEVSVINLLTETTRDRISAWHTFKPTTRITVHVQPAYNRYSFWWPNKKLNAEDTYSVDAYVIYQLMQNNPNLYISYGFSGEYGFEGPGHFVDTGFNRDVRSRFARSREIHFLALGGGYEFSDYTYGELLLGYGYDRIQSYHGPRVEGRLQHQLNEMFDAEMRAAYGISTESGTDDNEKRLGGYLRWRF